MILKSAWHVPLGQHTCACSKGGGQYFPTSNFRRNKKRLCIEKKIGLVAIVAMQMREFYCVVILLSLFDEEIFVLT